MRCKTHVQPERRANRPRGASFVSHFKDLCEAHNIQKENIYNFDETAIFIEDEDPTTLSALAIKEYLLLVEILPKFVLLVFVLHP
jgi:hypothetical protein